MERRSWEKEREGGESERRKRRMRWEMVGVWGREKGRRKWEKKVEIERRNWLGFGKREGKEEIREERGN